MRVFEAQEHWSWGGRLFPLPVRPMPEYRRRLPHFQPEDAYLFLTWRLWGSLPEAVKLVSHRTQGQAFVAQDRALDRRCSGPLWLKQPRIAALVAEAIQMGEGERHFYELAAWVVHAQSRALADPPQGSGTDSDEVAEGIDCTQCQSTSRTNRATVLAGRVLRPLRAAFDTTRPNHRLHRGEPCVGRTR